jgi:membrane associated rhomboid family serine protease
MNIIAFIYPFAQDIDFSFFTGQFALIPWELQNGNIDTSKWISPFLTIITYMFMHATPSHILFNMLFLWIFGNNIEDSMSRRGFIVFYLLTGIISAMAFVALNPGSKVFLVGASGAISGVLGAYLFLFPFAKVHVLVFIIPIRMPAIIFLVIWFAMQLSGYMGNEGNVAWISHISGFISGALLHRFFIVKRV